jgi:lipoprotein-anchoring transpeptidase ErfK/SrfK
MRPNGAAGWIRAGSVTLATTDLAIVVELTAHLLTVTRNGGVLLQFQVGIGKPATPTPTGEFFVTDLVQVVRNPQAYYGPYAIGLSGFSDTLVSFHGGPPQIAIHGTNDPAGIGQDTSNGCIHVANMDIRRLIRVVALGTPVLIVP